MNVVDALVVSVGLDPSGLKQGAKEATAATAKLSADLKAAAEVGEKAQTTALGSIAKGWNALMATQRKAADASVQAGKVMAGATERVADSGEKAIRTFGALFLLFAGAGSLKNFASSMIALDASVGRLAHNTGTTTEVISGIGRAAERMGGTFEGATAGLRGLSDAYQDLRLTGNNAIMEPLAKLQGLSGRVITFGKDAHENLLSIADALHTLEDKGQSALADRLGRQILGDEGLVNLAKKGRAAVLADEKASPKITKEQADAAQKLQAQLAAVRQGFQDIGNSILLDFGPAMIQAGKSVKGLVDEYGPLLKAKVAAWVKEAGDWFREHRGDVESFGTAIGNLATAAGRLATAFASQSPAMQALEAFALLMGGRVLKTIGLVRDAMTAFGAMPVPPALAAAIGLPLLGTAAVGAVLASGDPNKALVDGGHPDLGPRDNDLGLPGLEHEDLPENKAPSDPSRARGIWDWIKQNAMPDFGKAGEQLKAFAKATGFGDRLHDDPKTRDAISDTAKATGETRDILKAQRDGAGNSGAFRGVTASSGGLGGSGQHFGGGSSPGATLGDRGQGGRGEGPASLKNAQQKANAAAIADELRKTGAPDEGTAAVLGSMQTESSFNPRAHNDVAGGHTGLWQWDARRWPKVRAWIEKQGGDPWDARWQTRAYIAEGQAKPGDAIYDGGETSGGFRDVMDSKGNLGKAVHGVQRSERFGVGEEGGRAANAGKWLGKLPTDAPAAPTPLTPALAAPTTTPSGEPRIGDSAYFAALQRHQDMLGRRSRLTDADKAQRTADDALMDRYHQQQAQPAAPATEPSTTARVAHRVLRWAGKGSKVEDPADAPITTVDRRDPKLAPKLVAPAEPVITVDHAIRHVLKTMADARRLTHHNDNAPVPVEMTDRSAERIGHRTFGAYLGFAKKHEGEMPRATPPSMHDHAASYGRMMKVAEAGRYAMQTTHNVDRSVTSDTTVNGGIHVHTAATDARGIAADIEPHLRRADRAGRADYGLG